MGEYCGAHNRSSRPNIQLLVGEGVYAKVSRPTCRGSRNVGCPDQKYAIISHGAFYRFEKAELEKGEKILGKK